MVKVINDRFEKPQTIAGVATGAIALGVLVAQELEVSFVYVRPEEKKHGMKNQIEGHIQYRNDVVVVEDLISTGKSSLAVVDALRAEGCEVKYMVSVFNYGFEETFLLFKEYNVELVSLCDYSHLIVKALELDYIKQDEMNVLMQWRKSPATWGKQNTCEL